MTNNKNDNGYMPKITANLNGLLLVRESDKTAEITRVANLLRGHCERVYLCCSESQAFELDPRADLILDQSDVQALQTASSASPGKSWLVLTVEQCCVDEDRIRFLIQYRSDDRPATVYTHGDHSMNPEYAIWEKTGIAYLRDAKDLMAALQRADYEHGCERLTPPRKTAPHKATTETARLL